MAIDAYVKQEAREIGRWYGALGTFERYIARDVQVPTCEEWLKAHWQRFPATSPDGRKIIDMDHPALPYPDAYNIRLAP